MHIFSAYVYYLHAYLIPLDMRCSQTMCQPKLENVEYVGASQKLRKLNLVKTGLKSKFEVNP